MISYDECKTLLKDNDTPRNIFLHSLKVNAVSLLISHKLIEIGEDIDLELIDNASLLHDIKKFYSIKDRSIKHTKEGEKYLIEIGYPKIANVIEKHRFNAVMDESLKTWEEKIVYYADKRVKHDKVVSINERIEDLNERYEKIFPGATKRNEIARENLMKLEREIFNKLTIKPEDITEKSVKPYMKDDDY